MDGREFLQLSQQDLKEMIPAMGIVKKLSRLISKVYCIKVYFVHKVHNFITE